MNDSSIHYSKGGGITLSGPDAVELFRCATLNSALGLLSKGITPTRGLTMKRALAMCSRYTGKTYKRSQIEEARADLKTWCDTMKAALPVTDDRVAS